MERHLSADTAIFVALFAAHRLLDGPAAGQTFGGMADRLAAERLATETVRASAATPDLPPG